MIIGLVAAMDNELNPFLESFSIDKYEIRNKNTIYTCHYQQHTLILVCTGRGKVNATVYTQQLISQYELDIVFNVGVSGGIEPNSQIFDIYIGSKYCHYDVRRKQSENTFPNKLYYDCDNKVLELLLEIDPLIKQGIFGTGEGFVADKEQKERLYKDFDICAVDMESAAIAQCCYLNDIRFIGIRGICDNADEQAAYTGEDLQEEISNTIVRLVIKLLRKFS
ncbi:5'-methylthioadenosine/S-adenosylhomocysteine nucleosidase [Enterococcus rivorum]|uniref:adenosylhomocysteine nucleosidase n=1 Tax=Enterococcus rivorum TaxID=762845 RepID=A0A1E5KWK6_9ENTE|nr:5'-methylthioadenosine/S-adenosylhomocysteine nucleosidase [Enterococcus rivorum]MBP2100276.1 adenosylhomocysteine nucleosidase [Enterococcus rivorum]OEH81999.1 hypothetical protein BCR26_14910 [Enterococcus rivorum]